MAQSVKFLPHNHGRLGLGPQNPYKKSSMAEHACNARTLKKEGSLGLSRLPVYLM